MFNYYQDENVAATVIQSSITLRNTLLYSKQRGGAFRCLLGVLLISGSNECKTDMVIFSLKSRGAGTSGSGLFFSSWLVDCELRTNMSRWRNVSNCHSKRPLYILTKMQCDISNLPRRTKYPPLTQCVLSHNLTDCAPVQYQQINLTSGCQPY